MKRCNSCNILKEDFDFHKCKSRKDGLQSKCITCTKAYKAKNRDKIIEYQTNYRKNNPNLIKEQTRKYCRNNVDKVKISKKRWRDSNKEYYKEYRKNNREKIRENRRRWERNNPEKGRAKCRRRRANKILVGEFYSYEDELLTFKVFGLKCFKCGASDDISMDHHRPLIDKNPLTVTNAVPLCRSCNASKGSKAPEKFYTVEEINRINDNFLKIENLQNEQKDTQSSR